MEAYAPLPLNPAPFAPAVPVGPVGPVLPVSPVGPVGPVAPAGPVTPVGPTWLPSAEIRQYPVFVPVQANTISPFAATVFVVNVIGTRGVELS